MDTIGGVLPAKLPVLVREPVRLRPFHESDVELVVSVSTDPLIPLITTVPATGDRQDALTYVARQHERLSSAAGYSFAICEAATDVAVGQIGLWTHDLRHGRASVGYWVAARYRRRGYALAALAAVSRWGFTLDDVARLELYVEPWNKGSWKAAERVGYQREGLLRSWQEVGGLRRDMYVYSLLKSESLA